MLQKIIQFSIHQKLMVVLGVVALIAWGTYAFVGPTPILVRDVARVGVGHAVRYGAMTRNGRGEVVGDIVLMLKGASSEKTIEGVKIRMAEIQKSLPPV